MKTHEKTAKLSMQLSAESGYEATAEYQISPAQWGDVLRVCEGGLTFDTMRERDMLRDALEKLVGASRLAELEGMAAAMKRLPSDNDTAAGIAAIEALLATHPERA